MLLFPAALINAVLCMLTFQKQSLWDDRTFTTLQSKTKTERSWSSGLTCCGRPYRLEWISKGFVNRNDCFMILHGHQGPQQVLFYYSQTHKNTYGESAFIHFAPKVQNTLPLFDFRTQERVLNSKLIFLVQPVCSNLSTETELSQATLWILILIFSLSMCIVFK